MQGDWEYFVPIFNQRSYTFFEYQSLSLQRHTQKSPKWSAEEATLLEQIIEYTICELGSRTTRTSGTPSPGNSITAPIKDFIGTQNNAASIG
jgi:hypothetical protein